MSIPFCEIFLKNFRGIDMDNIVERIVEICKDKKIPVSKLEKDLGYGNGYLNPKKVSDVKAGRLMDILDYLDVSYEEFFNVGSTKTQETETILARLKKANPEFYNLIFSNKETLDTNSTESQIDKDIKFALPFADEKQKELIFEILRLSQDQVSAFLSIAKSLPDVQQAQDDSKQFE